MTKNYESPKPYSIVTAAKNEERNLPNLIQSVLKQTTKPVLWVIVDDGSTDNTQEIIKEAVKKHNWIKSIRLGGAERDLGLHYASLLRKGFDFAIEHCAENRIDYGYLGNVDADVILEKSYFKKLLKNFENNPKLGIASGDVKQIVRHYIIHPNQRIDEPRGAHMLIRRKCFEECGGISLSYSCDSVLKVKARLRGWDTMLFKECEAEEIRDVSSAESYWKGYHHRGKSAYYLNFNPLHVMIKSVIYSFRRPCYLGIAYLIGYFSYFIRRREQIDDDEIKEYYWGKWRKYLSESLRL